MREASAVVHGSADGGKEGPSRALSTGSGAGVAVQPVINTKEFFLDAVCRVVSGVGCALEVWTGKFSVLKEGNPRYEEGVVQSDVHGGRSMD